MANNLGFEYVLSVNEQATKQNLNTFIKKTFGEGKNAKLSVPIKIDIANSLSDINFDQLQRDIDSNIKNKLKVKATVVVDTSNIKTQLTSKINEIGKDLKIKVGLEIDPSAINLIAGTVDVMKTLNAEIDKVKNNMKELGKNVTFNIGNFNLGKQYDEVLETSKEIKEENKKTEASLEEQLDLQKRILQEKRSQMKQTEKDMKAERERLELAKERKANNDKLIQQEKDLRKEASNISDQIKAEKDKQKLYEKQNESLKKQSKEQEQLAKDLKKTNEEIKKLEEDKSASQTRLKSAQEEEQVRLKNIEAMKKENGLLKEKLATMQKMSTVANDTTTTSNKTAKSSKGTSVKTQADNTIKQVEKVTEKRIEQEQKVTKEVEKQADAQIQANNKVIQSEEKVAKARQKVEKTTSTSTTSSTNKSTSKGRKGKQVLYDRVQSADISKAIHDETVKGVRSLQEEEAEMKRLGNMVADERGLLREVAECLERNKTLTKENADEIQNLLTKLADEKTLIQETAGNRDYVDKQPFKKALKAYLADSNDENLAKLDFQAEKLGKIGGMYEYRMDVQDAINKLQKQYNIEAQRSIEIDEKQQQINEKRTSRATNIQSKAAENKVGFDVKKLKYRDAGSYVKEEMYGFSADQLAEAMEKYDKALEPFMDESGVKVDYGKTDDYIAKVKSNIEKLTVAMNNATDTQKIEDYNAKIEKLTKNINILQKTVNTYEHLNALAMMKEGVTFDLGEDKANDVDVNKVLNLKEIVSDFAQYSKGVNLAREQTSQMRQDLSWLAKDFDKLVASQSMDEEQWQKLADKTQQYKKELNVTDEEINKFIATKNEEIAQGNEHLAKLEALQKGLKRGTNEYRECRKAINDYKNALDNDLPIKDSIKDMKELINILDNGKDSINNFNNNTSGENNVKIVKKQKMSIEELAKQMENQDIMAEKVYLANKKNEKAMIDINQVIDKQRNTWKDLTGEVEKYYSKLSSEEVDKGLAIIRAEDKAEKNPNYRISTYMTKSLDAENLSLKEKISLLAEYEAKSKVLENLKRKVNQVEKYGLSYLEDEEDEIQRLNQAKQEQINKTIKHTKATQDNNKALEKQAKISKNISKIDVSQQNKNMQELFKSVALGDNNLENLSNLLKMVRNEVEKFSLALSSGTGLTDEARKSLYELKESFVEAEKALSIMEQKTSNANFTIEKGSKGFNTQKDKLAKLYKEIYNVTDTTEQSNKVREKASQIEQETANRTEKATNAIKQETKAIDDKTMALKSMALQAGIAEEKLDDLLMRIENVIGSGKKLSKTEMTKLAKDFPTRELASALERKNNLVAEGRKGNYNRTDEYKNRKSLMDEAVKNYTDNAFDLFQQIYEEAKKLDKVVEQTNKKVTKKTTQPKQEATQQNEVTKAVQETTQAKIEQQQVTTKVQDNHHTQMRQAIEDIFNMTNAQERFNKMLELTGLNYDELYKKYMNEMKNYTFDEMGIKNDRVQMDKIYTGNINLNQKEAVLSRISYLPEEPGQMTKSNMNLWKKYYAEADVISQVIGSMTKIVDDYNYEAKTAEQLIYQITEKGLNDQLAIEIALRKIEEERLGLLESIERAEKRLAEEKATRKVGTSEEIKALEEELKVLQNNPLYQRYNKAMEEESKRVLKLSNQELTPNNIMQSRFKIEGNLDMDMAYEKAINDFRRTTETLKYYNIKPEEVQEFVALYSKIKEVNSKISDIEYSMGESHEERIVENLQKRLAELNESSKELNSLLPKQKEQVQVQQQQAQAITETAQATEKLAQAQEKIKTNTIDIDSLNGAVVNPKGVVPDSIVALMEAQMGTYFKDGKVTASFKDYDYSGYDDPRDKMVEDYKIYHESMWELTFFTNKMVELAKYGSDSLNDINFQNLVKQFNELSAKMEQDIRDIISGLESKKASPFMDEEFSSMDEMLKVYPKEAWKIEDTFETDSAKDYNKRLQNNVKEIKEWIDVQKRNAEQTSNETVETIQRTQEMTSEREKAKLAESEYREELLKTKAVEDSVAETCEQLCRQIISLVDAQGELAKLNKDEYEIFDSFKQDALYGFDNISSGDLAWTYIAEGMIKSAKELGVAVDEQEKVYQKEMELLQNQENIGVKKIADDEYEITDQRTELREVSNIYEEIYNNVMKIVKASEQYKELRPGSEEADAFKLLEEDAKYALESGLNEEYWQTLAESAIDSAKILGVAVDEQEALFQKEIENYNKQIDLMAEQATFGNKITEQKAEQVQQEEKVAEAISETVVDYKSAYEEVMRLIEASKEYSKLSEESSEKIDFQDLRDRAETIDNDDVNQWKEMYQLSLALGDEMELNIDRERQLAKEKQKTLEKTKAILSDGRSTEQYWKDEEKAINEANKVIEESINAKKQETNVTEQLSQAQNESANKAKDVAKSKDEVTKASKKAKKALDEEKEALIASTNVKDHIQATLNAIDKINKSATFKKKAKEDSTLQDMFNELKREANVNKSSGILGVDYWDGLIDRIKIFATEMVKMKATTIDKVVNPLIYTNYTSTPTSNKKTKQINTPKSEVQEAKNVVDVKTKSVEVQKQETDAIKETTQAAKEYQQVIGDINIDTLKDNLGRTWKEIAEEEKKALSKVKEDLLFYELNNMEMDGLYSANNDASEKRYKATNYMNTTEFSAKNKKEAIDILSEYYAKTLVLHQLKQKENETLGTQVAKEEEIKVIEEERKDLVEERKTNIEEEAQAETKVVEVKQEQVEAEVKATEAKQEKVEVESLEMKQLKEQIALNEKNIANEEEMLQSVKDQISTEEKNLSLIDNKLDKARELKATQEQQLANANANSEKAKEEYKLQEEARKRVEEKIKALEEEKRIKEQMAEEVHNQILEEEKLGDTSGEVMQGMIDYYNKLRKEAEDTQKSIDLITKAIKEQEDYKEMSKTGVNPLQPINNGVQGTPNWRNGGNGGSGGGGGISDEESDEINRANEALSEQIKLKQRALMLDVEKLVYGKDLTDTQKLLVNELVEQIVALGKGVGSMKELRLESQKIKQNINETKFDVKVSTTEDKEAKKALEQQRKETEQMYKGLFDIAIAEEEAKANMEREKRNELTSMYTRLMNEAIAKEDARAKYVKEQTNMYTRLWEQMEKGIQAEERAKVVLEDKIAKQKELWQLKVKEFSQSDNSNYTDPKDVANMKQMADNIGNNITNMRELNQQLHEMSMAYKEISSSSKNTKAMFNDAEKAKEEAEANKEAQKTLKALIATKEEDLRQTHQNIVNGKAYREATDGQRQAFDEFRGQLKLTGDSTEEVNRQYKTLVQTMNGMKIDMTTDALRRQDTIFGKLKETVKQYISLNFDAMDIMRYFTTSLNEAWEHAKVLDEAYTNISMTMNVTNEQFQTMRETAMEVGNANGQLETSVLEMMKVYANAGTTVEQINDQMKATVAFQNVTGLDASAVTQSVQTIIQQYKLTEEGAMSAAEATEYLGDVMVAVAYDLAKEESVAMQEVVAGIETAGNMIKTSGGSFEWFTSVIGTLSEVMNASGSETANAINIFVA